MTASAKVTSTTRRALDNSDEISLERRSSDGKQQTMTQPDRRRENRQLASLSLLASRGSLDKRMDILRRCFEDADRTHRATLDYAVQECIRLARFLWDHNRHVRQYVSKHTAEELLKKGMDQDEFLRVVFQKSHYCTKKASFYFRATRAFYHSGLSLEAIPMQVTAAGGYRALAKANVRFPRSLDEVHDEEGDDDDLAEAGKKPNQQVKPPSQPKAVGNSENAEERRLVRDEEQLELVCFFEGDGEAFRDLPLPSLVSVGMLVEIDANGRRIATISSAVKTD